MSDDQNLIIEVLIKYALEQPLSEAEKQLLDEWRARSDEHQELPDQLRDPHWRELHRREISDAPSAEMWENISRYISEKEDVDEEGARVSGIRGWPAGRWVAAAVVVLVLVGVAVIAALWKKSSSGEEYTKNVQPMLTAVDRTDDSSNLLLISEGHLFDLDKYRPAEVIWAEGGLSVEKTEEGIIYRIKTRSEFESGSESKVVSAEWHVLSIGQKARKPFRVDFPGRHRVWLNNASQLAYAPGLKDGPDPILNGEAFFDIAPDAAIRPLQVRTEKGESLRVLGTSFGVRSFARERQSRIELYSGKVRVKSHDDSLILRPDSAVLLEEGSGPRLVRLDARRSMPHWLELRNPPYFEFENTPFTTALREVANWYSMSLSNPQHLKGIPVSGRLPRNESLDHTLRSFEQVESGRIALQRKGDTIIVQPGPTGP